MPFFLLAVILLFVVSPGVASGSGLSAKPPANILEKAGDALEAIAEVSEQVGTRAELVRDSQLAHLQEVFGKGASAFDPEALRAGHAVLNADAAKGLADQLGALADKLGDLAGPIQRAIEYLDFGKAIYQCIDAGVAGDKGRFVTEFNQLVRDQLVSSAKYLGAKTGASLGAAAGMAGGPLALITGAAGYFAGGYLAEKGAEKIYDEFLSDFVSNQVASKLFDSLFGPGENKRWGLSAGQVAISSENYVKERPRHPLPSQPTRQPHIPASPLAASPGAPSYFGGVAVALVMDCSGSMNDDNRFSQAVQAAVSLARSLGGRDQIAIIRFSSGASTVYPMGAARRSEVIEAVKSLQVDGGTAIGLGILRGLDELASANGMPRAILLMTDGENNQAEEALAASIDRAARERVPIYTVGFGLTAGRSLLEDIARRTGGLFTTADTGSLAQTYLHLRSFIRNDTTLALIRGAIRQGQSRAHQLSVPSGSHDLCATLTWQGSRMTLSLVSPRGRRFSAKQTHGLSGVEFEELPEENLVMVRMARPEAGEWKVIAFGEEIPPQGEIYTFSASAATPLKARSIPLPSYVNHGDSVRIGVAVGDTVPGAVVTASIGRGRYSRSVSLNDQGLSGDERAGDGTYSSVIESSRLPGIHPLTYTVRVGNRSVIIRDSLQVGSASDVLAAASSEPPVVGSAAPWGLAVVFLALVCLSIALGIALHVWSEPDLTATA